MYTDHLTPSRGRMRPKIPLLVEALTGHFDDHHAFLARRMLDRVDALAADITAVDEQIGQMIAPFAAQVTKLDELPGVNQIAARELIAAIGVDMTRFPTAAHLVSWAKFAPLDHKSAGKGKGGATGKGDPYLAATLGEIAASLARTHTFLGARYRRIAKRRGKLRAIVAIGNSILTIYWILLSNPTTRYTDLGEDHYHQHANTSRRRRRLIRQLEALTGSTVTLQPAA